MSEHTFDLPDVGEGVAEAEIDEWYVAVGDTVAEDQPVVSVLTDKATLELTSPVAGLVVELGAAPGERVAVGAPLLRFAADGDAPPTATDAAPPTVADPARPVEAPAASTDVGTTGGRAPSPPASSRHPEPASVVSAAPRGAAAPPRPAGRVADRVLASPAVRQRALTEGIDLRLVSGSGPADRVTHDDLTRHVEAPAVATSSRRRDGSVREIPIRGVRRRIADKMSLSKQRIPHITIVEEVDVTALESLRVSLNEQRPEDAPRLTPLAFIVRALVGAIAEHPAINSLFDDDAGVVHEHGGVHVGIAAQTPSGLVVPVIDHAESLGLWDTAREIERLAAGAREATLTRDEMTGSTVTISSLGALGGVVTTPVINHPEVAIVGVNKRQTRPVWDGAAFRPREVMNLSCGFDHRIIDGHDAALFIQGLKRRLEEPVLMFAADI